MTAWLSRFIQRIQDSVQEQAWFQQLRSKWDELDAQSRLYLQWAAGVGALLIVGWIFIGTAWKVHGIKSDLAEKEDLLRMIQAANDELSDLKGQIPAQASATAAASAQPLKDYLGTLASAAGLAPGVVDVTNERAGAAHEGSKEALAQVSLKKLNIKQLVRFLFQLENGSRPVKLRNLGIEAHPDHSGYLDATLQVSAFSLKSG